MAPGFPNTFLEDPLTETPSLHYLIASSFLKQGGLLVTQEREYQSHCARPKGIHAE